MTGFAIHPIKFARQIAGMPQEAMATKAHVDVRTWARYEGGESIPRRDVLASVSKACGVPLVSTESPGAAAHNLIKQLDDVTALKPTIQEITYDDDISEDQSDHWDTVRKELVDLAVAIVTVLYVPYKQKRPPTNERSSKNP